MIYAILQLFFNVVWLNNMIQWSKTSRKVDQDEILTVLQEKKANWNAFCSTEQSTTIFSTQELEYLILTVGLIIGKRSLNLPETEQDESGRERGEGYWTRTIHLLAQPLVHPWPLPPYLESLVPYLLWSFVALFPPTRLSIWFTLNLIMTSLIE